MNDRTYDVPVVGAGVFGSDRCAHYYLQAR